MFIRDNSHIIRKMDLAFISGLTEKSILVTGKIMPWMERVSAHGQMEKSTQESGSKMLNMVEVSTNGAMVECTTVITIMIKNMAGVSIDGLTEECILESGYSEIMMKKEYTFCQMVMSRKQNGLTIRKVIIFP